MTEKPKIQSFLVCCTQVITNEAAHKEITQKAIAMTYAMAIIKEVMDERAI